MLWGLLSAFLRFQTGVWRGRATDTERVLAPGVEVVLEVVRMAVNEQYPSLMPTLYPEGYGIEAVQHFERRWLAFQKLANITPVINENYAIKEDKNSIITMTGIPKPVLRAKDYRSLSHSVIDDIHSFCKKYTYSTDFLDT